jgi:hypothetical protein
MSFNSFGDFWRWKELEQEKKCVFFTKQNGSHMIGQKKYACFVCQHDDARNRNQSQLPKTSRRYKKGRVKRGFSCPARLLVKEDCVTGSVTVTYIASHSHALSVENIKFQPLSIAARALAAQKLSLGDTDKEVISSGSGIVEESNQQAVEDEPLNDCDVEQVGFQMYDTPSGPITKACENTASLTRAVKEKIRKLHMLIGKNNVKGLLLSHVNDSLTHLLKQCQAVAADDVQMKILMKPQCTATPSEVSERQIMQRSAIRKVFKRRNVRRSKNRKVLENTSTFSRRANHDVPENINMPESVSCEAPVLQVTDRQFMPRPMIYIIRAVPKTQSMPQSMNN